MGYYGMLKQFLKMRVAKGSRWRKTSASYCLPNDTAKGQNSREERGFHLPKEEFAGGRGGCGVGALSAPLQEEADSCVSIQCGNGLNHVAFPGCSE